MTLDGVVRFPPEAAARYRAAGYWDDRLLIHHYEDAFERFVDRIAIIDDDTSLTYAELRAQSLRLARNLYDEGLRSSDRVVVQLRNTALFPPFYLALQYLGAIPIMALPVHRHRELEQFVRLSGAVALASPAMSKDVDHREIHRRIAREHPFLRLHLIEQPDDGGSLAIASLLEREPRTSEAEILALQAGIDPEDPAVFQLSGGTTGIPKLIPRSHNDYAYNSRAAAALCDIRAGDVLLDALPISHNLPLACPGMQGFLFAGATVSLVSVARTDAILDRVARDRATHIHLVPALLIKLSEEQATRPRDVTTLRVIQSGGQRLQPETRQRATALFTSATVQENFGMAEGMLMFVRLDDPDDVRMETVGRPVSPDDEVRLVDEDGRDVQDGEVGEFWARGPYTLRGYYQAEEHNRTSFSPDGFYMSGDLMWRHPTGNYVVAGRRKDLINRGGEKISAEEIENLILAHPAVVLAAAVPVPDPVLGERTCACVVLRPGATLDLPELVAFLREYELATFKLPESLRVFDELPLSPIGKVSKKDLVALLSVEAG